MKLFALLLPTMLLCGCSLFGRTTVVHDRMVVIPLPEPPKLEKAVTAEEWQQNFQQVGQYAIRLTRGVHLYNEYAVQHNLKHGYFKEEEMDAIRETYRLPPPRPESKPEENPGQ